MKLDSVEISGLRDVLNELNENVVNYEKHKETGNSKGEHKEFYRGKFEAYSRCKTLLYRYLKWHSVIEVDDDGNYYFLEDKIQNKIVPSPPSPPKDRKLSEGGPIKPPKNY